MGISWVLYVFDKFVRVPSFFLQCYHIYSFYIFLCIRLTIDFFFNFISTPIWKSLLCTELTENRFCIEWTVSRLKSSVKLFSLLYSRLMPRVLSDIRVLRFETFPSWIFHRITRLFSGCFNSNFPSNKIFLKFPSVFLLFALSWAPL